MQAIAKRFGAVRALGGVDLEVRRGEVHALIGENGAGKSTLMKVLSGATAPDSGAMELDGRAYAPRGPRDALSRGVAMIYQELVLAPDLSVAQNLLLGREAHRLGVLTLRAQRTAIERVLALLGSAELHPDRAVGELGPGPRQLVELGRALLGEARVVVLDEPTSSLSAAEARALDGVIARLTERGVSIVYISHFLEDVQRVAHRYTVLRDGRSVASGELASTTLETILEAMLGRSLGEVYPRVPHEPGEVVLELDRVRGVPSPSSASLTLRRGEILGIAGLVGAGRTELCRAIYGLAPVRAGRVVVASVADRGRPVHARIAQGLGLLSEDRKHEGLALGMSIADNVTLSRPPARLGVIDRRGRASVASQWMARLSIRARDPEQPVSELSGGNQQKVALARLLHQDADVLLLDEPTRGVDVGSKVEIYQRIGELAAAQKAVLMISSYLPELVGICDRIAVMHRGVLGEARAVSEWTESALLEEATRGAA
jgi:ribose transport system ATP-binding protein